MISPERTPLPVLQSSAVSEKDLIRLYHRTTLNWHQQIAESTELDVGTALTSAEFSKLPEANLMWEASLPDGTTAEQVVALAEAHFAAAETRCLAWALNPSEAARTAVAAKQADAARIAEVARAADAGRTPLFAGWNAGLAASLQSRGFHADTRDIWIVRRAPVGPIREIQGLKIIPARASFRHATQIAELSAAESAPLDPIVRRQRAEATLRRLDDPHWDALLAIQNGSAVACVGALAVGELGRIDGLFVADNFRSSGIGRTMMRRALEICARSQFKHVFTQAATPKSVDPEFLSACGFEKVGNFTTHLLKID
jgi:N-acetylglutamate synthase-like GNAT family acetyltransferase